MCLLCILPIRAWVALQTIALQTWVGTRHSEGSSPTGPGPKSLRSDLWNSLASRVRSTSRFTDIGRNHRTRVSGGSILAHLPSVPVHSVVIIVLTLLPPPDSGSRVRPKHVPMLFMFCAKFKNTPFERRSCQSGPSASNLKFRVFFVSLAHTLQ